MSENLDALKRGYDAFNSGDVETLSALYTDDAVWEGPATEGVPMSGRAEGKDAVLQALGQIGEVFESFHVDPETIVEQGDTIVVLSHIKGKTKAGPELNTSGVEAWTMGGGVASHVRSWSDTALFKETVGA